MRNTPNLVGLGPAFKAARNDRPNTCTSETKLLSPRDMQVRLARIDGADHWFENYVMTIIFLPLHLFLLLFPLHIITPTGRKPCPHTRLVSAGSMIPSSHKRAVE